MRHTESVKNNPLTEGNRVFFKKTEELPWNYPFPMKQHHVPETRSVILQGEVIDVRGDEFKAKLFDNNGFEKDGQTFVFHKNALLCEQNFTDLAKLGQWRDNPSLNNR